MSNSEENYNFDDDFDVSSSKNKLETENSSTVQRNSESTKSKHSVLLWENIKPMLHYYIIALIAFVIAGVMMHSAYRKLYPEKKSTPAQSKSLNFSKAGSQSKSNHQENLITQENGKRQINNESVNSRTVTSNSQQNKSEFKNNHAFTSADYKEINSKLESLESKVDQLSQGVKNLTRLKNNSDSSNDKLKEMIEKIQNGQSKINKNISLLSSGLSSSNNKVNELEETVKKENSQIKLMIAKQYNHREKLSLRAIITGRAWLVNNAGVTLTVTKDSDIPGYGHVVNIDDKKDEVVMSSGFIFS
ncbi:hypothetical protein [Piscirickettsia litoralis]|uniref:Intracellular multiplication protein IcmG n=1 Tax=Piscirickettsia litoralis TaxID=1891921 RepID=A0ABX3A1H8_9GAMM|nr:hypothetical protein [Piscirickettsia litoralis]ODN42489.1 hypothetical protein BGC07_05560 [Piscirickettsia litoralis]